MARSQTVRKIVIYADDRTAGQLQKIANQLNGMDSSLAKTAKSTTTLKNAFLGLSSISFAGIGIKQIIGIADNMQLLTDKMSIYAKEGETGLGIMSQISDAASRQGQSIDDLATIYNRLQVATMDMNLTTEQALTLTETLAESFRLAGSSGSEMRGVVIQLSQALGAGALQGQELRSVMEGNALIAIALKTKMKSLTTDINEQRMSIFKFAEKRGGFSAIEVFEALADSADKWKEQAKSLKLTIGQGLNIVTNILSTKMNELNASFGITEKVVNTLLFAADNLDLVFSVLAVTVGIVFKGALASLVTGVGGAAVALGVLGSTLGGVLPLLGFLLLPLIKIVAIGAALTAVVYGIVQAFTNWDGLVLKIQKSIKYLEIGLSKLGLAFFENLGKVEEKILGKTGGGTLRAIESRRKNLAKLRGELDNIGKSQDVLSKKKASEVFSKMVEDLKSGKAGLPDTLAMLNRKLDERTISTEKYTKAVLELRKAEIQGQFVKGQIDDPERQKRLKELTEGKIKGTKDLNAAMASLNKQYFANTITLKEYYEQLDSAALKDTTEKAKSGRASLEEYFKAMDAQKVTDLKMQLNQGAISADTYARSIASIDMDTLKRQLDGNRISLIEYDRQLISVSSKLEAGSAFRTGAQDYIQSIGTLAQSVASGVTTVFKSLEDGLVEMLEQGAFDMQKFTKIIISEINRIIIRATIMRAVAGIATGGGGGIQHAFGSMDTAGTRSGEVSLTAAQGMAFDNGVQKFAKGGVVGSPTLFRHSGGTGLMGEAGPEAIAPLRRTKSGDLGIQSTTPNVTVNVINNTPDTETTQVERKGKDGSKILDVIITQKVKEAFAKGAFDTSLKTQYGINRRGA